MEKILLNINKFFKKHTPSLLLEDCFYVFLFIVFMMVFCNIGWIIVQYMCFLFN